MTPRLTITIQHHPTREPLLDRLTPHIGSHRIVTDPQPHGPPSPWRTYRRCLTRPTGKATHHLILQDDVRVCEHFRSEAFEAVRDQPGHMLSFFTGRYPQDTGINARYAYEAGERWYVERRPASYVSTVALVWPVYMVGDFLAFVDAARWWSPLLADDEIVSRWVKQRSGTPVLHRLPNLVEHPDDVATLHLGSPRRPRVSVAPPDRLAGLPTDAV